ncbi:hypothetical protein FPOAC2_10333 [Fusarium poae]|uniref:uncharacterized protein n=1 Tax=Fusarium poae TaxID=36050 RepID=UPI001D0598AC|nr:uncharacterized protein FPOAC1_014091 [Fusarium poae]XP_044701047.1 uncharacterized protein FPOAC1_013325 [Fusarium poae]KAG8664122.1 hypothetical protein FPOAC1_014091 [Fusarium poae]KAG8664544.1 hypothetical protein FPOAC1_013325 [Fusarium poae]
MSDAAQPHPAAVAKVLPSGITSDLVNGDGTSSSHAQDQRRPSVSRSSPGYRVKGPPELMLEQLRDLLHLVWYPYRRQRLVRKPTPRKAVHFEPHDQEQHFFPTDPPVTVKSEPQLMRGVHEGSARKPPSPIASLHIIRSPPTRWEVICSTTVSKITEKTTVKLERLWVSADESSFLGSVAVANLTEEKSVTCRFTFDRWETISEVRAHYAGSLPVTSHQAELDRFLFTLKLPNVALVRPGINTFHCCIRYIVNGQEFWDNNNGLDYQVSFRRKEPSKDMKTIPYGASTLQSDVLV